MREREREREKQRERERRRERQREREREVGVRGEGIVHSEEDYQGKGTCRSRRRKTNE